MENQTTSNAVETQGAPAQSITATAIPTKKPFNILRFFVGVTGEKYEDVEKYGATGRYATIGFSTLLDPMVSFFLFTMAAALNASFGMALLSGLFMAVLILLVELVVVRTTPLGQIYQLFTGQVKGKMIAFVLLSLALRGGISYGLGAINAPRAIVVLYQDGILAFDKKAIAAKREAEISQGKARRDANDAAEKEAARKVTEAEEAHRQELLKGGSNGRPAGPGRVARKLEDAAKAQRERLAQADADRKAADAREASQEAELAKLRKEATTYDYTTMNTILDKMAAENPTIRYEKAVIHWLCILLGIIAFLMKSMMKPGAYERFKESREEQLIAQIEIDALTLTQKLSESKLQESIARQQIENAEKQILLADPIEYMKKYAVKAYDLIKSIQDKGRQEAARREIDGHILKAVNRSLDYKTVKVNIEESMPTTGYICFE